MALAIDASSPGIATNTNSATATVTTGSFTPPTGSLLVIMWGGNASASENPAAPTITDSLVGHLTYTLVNHRNHGDAGGSSGQVAMWTAPVVTGLAQTITVTTGSASGNREAAVKVLVFTGADIVTPTGTVGEASAGSGAFSQAVTSTIAGGWALAVWGDWQVGSTTFTAGTGCATDGTSTCGGNFNVAVVRRSTADGAGSGSNTVSLTAPTSNAQNWVYAEIRAGAGGAAAASLLIPRRPSSGLIMR